MAAAKFVGVSVLLKPDARGQKPDSSARAESEDS